MKKFKKIELKTWNRRSQYEFFMNHFQFPHTSITAPVDVTRLSKFCKSEGYSFFQCCVYFLGQTLNEIKEFRQRARETSVIEWESVNPSYTLLTKDKRFLFCDVEYNDDFLLFLKTSKEKSKIVLVEEFEDDLGKDDNRLFMSCLPWTSFTQISHPIHSNQFDSTPRIAWGKISGTPESLSMPLNIQAHHALVDGYHLGLAFQSFQEKINAV